MARNSSKQDEIDRLQSELVDLRRDIAASWTRLDRSGRNDFRIVAGVEHKSARIQAIYRRLAQLDGAS